MAGFNLKKDIKGRGVSSITHGANPQLIDSLQDFHLKFGYLGIRISFPDVSQKGFLGQKSRSLKGTSDAHTHHRGRTGIRS